jgi:protein-arginine kinase activator protein McsA
MASMEFDTRTCQSSYRYFEKNNKCKHETMWQCENPSVTFGRDFINEKAYVCRNCGKEITRYFIIWQEREANNIFLKVGQYPELEERVSETLEQRSVRPI